MEEILYEFERIGEIFNRWYVEDNFKDYDKNRNWKNGIMTFLNIAFERQGRPPDWSEIAKDIIGERNDNDIYNMDKEKIAKRYWGKFKDEWEYVTNKKIGNKNKGLNVGVNPFAPENEKYYRKYKGKEKEYHAEGISVIALLIDLKKWEYDIVRYVQEEVKQNAGNVHTQLKKINGVSNKIASMFMRDVVTHYDIGNKIKKDRHLLQPIDVWVKRCCNYLPGHDFKNKNYGEIIVKICSDEINPEKVNMGMWLFSSQIVGNHYRLKKIMEQNKNDIITEMRERIKNYKERLERRIKAIVDYEKE